MTSYGAKIASIPDSLERLLDLYDEGQLPPDEQIEMAQQLIDMDLDDYLTQYQQLCDYCIAEGMCYDVEVGQLITLNDSYLLLVCVTPKAGI